MARTPSTCLPFDAPLEEDNQGEQPVVSRSVANEAQFPRGELVAIGVTLPPPRGMVSCALEEVHSGDGVELGSEP